MLPPLIARKALPTLFMYFLVSPVFANGYCDSRQTQKDYDNCYRVNIEAQTRLLEKNYREVINHPNLPADNRAKLEQNQNEWTDQVNSQCRDNSCMLSALENRNSQLRKLYQELQGPNTPATAPKTAASAAPRLTLEQLKAAIRKDHKYEVGFGQVPNQSRTRLDYAGLITYQGQQYVIPANRITEIIPTYVHTGEVSEDGWPKIPGGYCRGVDQVCKDSTNETLGVLPAFWEELKRQKLIPSDVVTANSEVTAPVADGEACYEQKMADFRKENGEEAMIIHDQIVEWEQQCGLPTE